jgi:hypothetical protein
LISELNMNFRKLAVCFLIINSFSIATYAQEDLRMNQIQFVGTHNSYHVGLAPGEMALLQKLNPRAAESLAYKHPKIESQLDAGVRQLELDVWGDTNGGLFADPLFLRMAAQEGRADPMPAGWAEAIRRPGFKVLHANDVDFRSHCWTLVACLQDIRKWSKAHPGHVPIYIQLENKTGRQRPGGTKPEALSKATMDSLDAEIRSVFAASEIVTPDDVRGTHKTLEEAVLQDGWPKLDWARSKVVFVLDQERVTPFYTDGHPLLEGRMMFTNGKPGTPDAAFVKLNDPTSPEISKLVSKGYLVRTMTDGGARAVRTGDGTRRDQGMASGSQILSTDYPFDWRAEGSGYNVAIPGKVRCNPVNAPKNCAVRPPY